MELQRMFPLLKGFLETHCSQMGFAVFARSGAHNLIKVTISREPL